MKPTTLAQKEKEAKEMLINEANLKTGRMAELQNTANDLYELVYIFSQIVLKLKTTFTMFTRTQNQRMKLRARRRIGEISMELKWQNL